jgi:hypothetical protein
MTLRIVITRFASDPIRENHTTQITPSFTSFMRSFSFQTSSLRQAWFVHLKRKVPQQAAGVIWVAEKEGFEPPVPWIQDNGFQDRRIRPLCHFSFKFKTAAFATAFIPRSFSEAGPFLQNIRRKVNIFLIFEIPRKYL